MGAKWKWRSRKWGLRSIRTNIRHPRWKHSHSDTRSDYRIDDTPVFTDERISVFLESASHSWECRQPTRLSENPHNRVCFKEQPILVNISLIQVSSQSMSINFDIRFPHQDLIVDINKSSIGSLRPLNP